MNQIKQATILAVDDDEFNLKLLMRMLTAEGHAVRTAASGEEALASVAEQLPDLILLDVMMPGIDGFEVARRLKADSRTLSIPIIMVTALEDNESRLKGLDAGAEEFITKPVDCTEFLVRVRNLLKLKEYQDFLVNHNAILEEEIRKRTATLQESEEKYRNLANNAIVGIYKSNIKGEILYINDAALKIYEYVSREEFISNGALKRYKNLEDRKVFIETLKKTGVLENYELELTTRTGKTKNILLSARLEGDELSGMIMDITGRKQAEAAIQHANRALATLSAVNRTLVRATDENELLQAICDAIVKQKGYRMAWVGYKQHDESKSIKTMAHAGYDEGYLDSMQITWAESERGMGLSGCTIRSGATQLCQDIANDPLFLPWRDAALQRGYAASIALPLLDEDGTVFGILHVYSGKVNDFTPGEVELLEEMAGDLTFGVLTLHTRRERDLAQDKVRQQIVQLQDSLENTVRAMAAIVEMRDPYTAGHQERVADLAAAIAKQMAFPEEQIHAIHLAGIVHDLGKIRIPAEILSKPGKITDLEFGLIKTHAQAGYDILKDINFPWPIAQMVLQHHERLDGSGYPQGLKGEAILPEARILAVADVVEAIFSHRPYRPGLGIEAALAEITKQRGVHYDPQVVDACLALFREQGYGLMG